MQFLLTIGKGTANMTFMYNLDTGKTYSIIIPHHNIPKLLRRLLCSIPKRLNNFGIL